MKWLGSLMSSNPSAQSIISHPASQAQQGQSQGISSGAAIQAQQSQSAQQYQLGSSWQYSAPYSGIYNINTSAPVNYIFDKNYVEALFKDENFRKELKKFVFKEEMKKLINGD